MPGKRPITRPLVLIAGTWLVGAAAAVTIGYFAIQRIGDDLNTQRADPISQVELSNAARSEPEVQPGSTTIESPATSTTEDQTTTAEAPPVAPTRTTTSATSTTQQNPSTTTVAPAAQTKRFTTEGGVAAMSCSGQAISLLYAYPNDGYTANVDRNPQRVEVEFHSPARDVHLSVRCVDGVPADSGWGEDDDHGGR